MDTGTLLLRLPVPVGVVLVVVAVPVGDLLEAMTIVDLFWCWILYYTLSMILRERDT